MLKRLLRYMVEFFLVRDIETILSVMNKVERRLQRLIDARAARQTDERALALELRTAADALDRSAIATQDEIDRAVRVRDRTREFAA